MRTGKDVEKGANSFQLREEKTRLVFNVLCLRRDIRESPT